jgi:hypothetical protein
MATTFLLVDAGNDTLMVVKATTPLEGGLGDDTYYIDSVLMLLKRAIKAQTALLAMFLIL